MDQIELSNVQYFNPIIVAFVLFIFIGDPITPSLILGSLIVFSSQYIIQSKNTNLGASNATILLSLPIIISVYYLGHNKVFKSQLLIDPEAPAIVGTVFTILIGFTLSRIQQRNASLDEKLFNLHDSILSISRICKINKNNILFKSYIYALSDFEWLNKNHKDAVSKNLNNTLNQLTDELEKNNSDNESIKAEIETLHRKNDEWIYQRSKGIPKGELISIWILGAMTIFSLISLNDGGFYRDIFTIAFSLCVVYLCALVKDTAENHNGRNFKQFSVILNLFRHLNIRPYLPYEIHQSKKVPDVLSEFTYITMNKGSEEEHTIKPIPYKLKSIQLSLLILSALLVVVAFFEKYL